MKNGKLKESLQLNALEYNKVSITDTFLNNAFSLETDYLLQLEEDRLLAGFLETAGLMPKAERYPGWESTEIGGHTLGHYLSALAQVYGETRNQLFFEKIRYVISELKTAQAKDGYLFASPKELFDRVEKKQPVWVPWYTMHKIMEGLIAVYRFTSMEESYEVVTKLGDWIYRRCIRWDAEMKKVVLAVEYGGMNDCLYDLYLVSGDIRYAHAAHQFDEEPLFRELCQGHDVLNGLHANTTIPKIIGALKRYVAFGETEQFYFTTAKNFWNIVVAHHTYITGGNSEWEHFGEPDILDEERTACNCETCNTYNMLKLTKLLFQITKDKKYGDFYERAFINSILSSQNPKTGMTTYFQPMETGYFKVYGTPFDRFWCCTGTGMENFTKLTEGIYFIEENTIYINRYVDSKLEVEPGIELKVTADFLKSEKVTIVLEKQPDAKKQPIIALRIPEWISGECMWINDGKYAAKVENGYLLVDTKEMEENCFTCTFPMKPGVRALPDSKDTVAFTYGPFVLSAELGQQMMDTTTTGVDVLVPMKELLIKDYIILDSIDTAELKKNIADYLMKEPGQMTFRLQHVEADRELYFIPHFLQHEERYGIYFRLYKKDSENLNHYREQVAKKQRLAKQQVDTIPIGNNQYELAHKIRGEKTDTTRVEGHRCRFAKEGGWFSYEMRISEEARWICVTYCRKDAGNQMDIYLNDIYFLTEEFKFGSGNFYTARYPIPEELIEGNNTVTVKFQNKSADRECRIFDELYIKK